MIDGETESRWCNFEIRFSILKNFLQNLLKHIRKVGRLSCAFSKTWSTLLCILRYCDTYTGFIITMILYLIKNVLLSKSCYISIKHDWICGNLEHVFSVFFLTVFISNTEFWISHIYMLFLLPVILFKQLLSNYNSKKSNYHSLAFVNCGMVMWQGSFEL